MRCLIVGDIHAYQRFVWPWRLCGKRLFAYANEKLNRSRRFDLRLLDSMAEQAQTLHVDWALCTGDLTGSALPGEFEQAKRFLQRLVDQGVRLAVVPGNHDRYTFACARRRAFEHALAGLALTAFPSLIQLSPRWRLMTIDSAVPRLISSRGRIGGEQLAKLRRLTLQTPEQDGLVVLCHYPFDTPPGVRWRWSHRLADRELLRAWLGELAPRPVVFVHGHIHQRWSWRPTQPELTHVQVINAGSPTQSTADYPRGRGFWLLDLPDDPQQSPEIKDCCADIDVDLSDNPL